MMTQIDGTPTAGLPMIIGDVADDTTPPPLEEAADADLVLRTRSGDREAFGQLWSRHYASGLTVARSVTSSLEADDLVQEAYARIYQSILKGGGPTGSFRAYLFTSIRNTAAAWGRSRKETATDELDSVEDPATSEQATSDALDRSLTHQAFRSLPTRWQEVLWYSEIEQMKPAEIAPLLGMKATAVAQLTFRAREGLREAWIQAHLRSLEDGSDCQWTVEHLGAYARHNLGARHTVKLEKHLAECARCAIVAGEAKDVSHRLALVLLPLTVGVAGTAGYLASIQGGGASIVALAAMPSAITEGAVTVGAASGTVASGAAAAGTAGGAASGAAASGTAAASATVVPLSTAAGVGAVASAATLTAGAAGGGLFSGITTAAGIAAASAVMVGAVVAGAVVPGMMATPDDKSVAVQDPGAAPDAGDGVTLPEAPTLPSAGPQPEDLPVDVTAPVAGGQSTDGAVADLPVQQSDAVPPAAAPVTPVTPDAPPSTPVEPVNPAPVVYPVGQPAIGGVSTSRAIGQDPRTMSVAVSGVPGASVEVMIDDAPRTSTVLGADGRGILTVVLSSKEFVTAAMRMNYAIGDWNGESTTTLAPVVWDAQN